MLFRSYYIAGGYMNQEGTAPHSSLSKYTFRTTVDSSVASWLRVGSNVTLGYDERTTANSISNSVYNAAFISLLSRPDTNPYNEDGTEKEKIDNYYNPNYLASKTPSVGRKMQINANASTSRASSVWTVLGSLRRAVTCLRMPHSSATAT